MRISRNTTGDIFYRAEESAPSLEVVKARKREREDTALH
jgi:hypothetical protein